MRGKGFGVDGRCKCDRIFQMEINSKNNKTFPQNCAVCRGKMRQSDFSLVLRKDNSLIFHANCLSCGTSSIFVIMEREKGFLEVGLLSDLTKKEAKRKLNMKPISSDEIIAIYECFKKEKE